MYFYLPVVELDKPDLSPVILASERLLIAGFSTKMLLFCFPSLFFPTALCLRQCTLFVHFACLRFDLVWLVLKCFQASKHKSAEASARINLCQEFQAEISVCCMMDDSAD
jgi:hypothetical protein